MKEKEIYCEVFGSKCCSLCPSYYSNCDARNPALEDVDKEIKCHLSSWGHLSIDLPPGITQSTWVTVGIDLYNKEFC